LNVAPAVRAEYTDSRTWCRWPSRRESTPEHSNRCHSYRIFDRYHRHAVSLAFLTDERVNWRPEVYQHELWDCSTQFRYPVIKLTDWRARRVELEASENPFAVVVLAHLGAQDTKGDMVSRQQLKQRLIRRLYERGYGREKIVSLFRFIDWLLALPDELEQQIQQTIRGLEEERAMPYVTSIERMGREQGRVEGREEGKRAAVALILEQRFGLVSGALSARIAQADESALDAMLVRAITVTRAEDL